MIFQKIFEFFLTTFHASQNYVLMYHRIVDELTQEFGPAQYSLPRDTFKKQIEYMVKKGVPLTLDDYVKGRKSGKKLPDNSFVITFDDGYKDTYKKAFPILKKFSVPATIFVTTSFLSGECLPFEYRLVELVSRKTSLDFSFEGRNFQWDLNDHHSIRECYEKLQEFGKSLHHSQRRKLLENLIPSPSDEKQPENPWNLNELMMDKSDLKELSDSELISLGSHGQCHHSLVHLDPQQVEREVIQSKSTLEEISGEKIHAFSYAYGENNRRVRKVVREAGFEHAVTTSAPWWKTLSPFDPYRIPRMDASIHFSSDNSS